MKIDIWSDYACPFCYIGETRLNKALAELDIKDETELNYRNFQLNPQATSHPDKDINTLLAEKYGMTYEQAKMNNQSVMNEAKKSGLDYDFENIKPNNTRMAHELTRYAAEFGKEEAMAEVLFSAYFEKGIDIGLKDNLVQLAREVGLDQTKALEALDQERYKEVVLKDQDLASSLGVSSVPFFVIEDQYSISGAQSQEYFNQVIRDLNTKI